MWDVLRVWGLLFLPLFLLLELGSACGAGLYRPPYVEWFYWLLSQYLPPLLPFSHERCRMVLSAAALSVGAFILCPDRLKKAYLCILSAAYLAALLGPSFTTAYLAACLGTWIVLNTAWLFWVKLALVLPICAVPFLFAAAESTVNICVLAWALCIKSALKAYSALMDTSSTNIRPRWMDIFLLWTGGFPCNFQGPFYTYAAFGAAYLKRSYRDIAEDGVASIYAGLGCACFVLMVEAAFLPRVLDMSVREAAAFSSTELWIYGAVQVNMFLVGHAGCNQLLQGANRLFGYDVISHVDKPWLSSSPMDFWRRTAYHSRNYMLKYVFYPFLSRTRSIGLAVVATFLTAFLPALLYAWMLWRVEAVTDSDGRAGRLLLLLPFLLFGCFAYMELRVRGAAVAAPLRALVSAHPIVGAWSGRLAMLALCVLISVPGRKSFEWLRARPDLIPGRTRVDRAIGVYGKLLFVER